MKTWEKDGSRKGIRKGRTVVLTGFRYYGWKEIYVHLVTSVFFFLLKYDSRSSSENGEVSGIASLKKR